MPVNVYKSVLMTKRAAGLYPKGGRPEPPKSNVVKFDNTTGRTMDKIMQTANDPNVVAQSLQPVANAGNALTGLGMIGTGVIDTALKPNDGYGDNSKKRMQKSYMESARTTSNLANNAATGPSAIIEWPAIAGYNVGAFGTNAYRSALDRLKEFGADWYNWYQGGFGEGGPVYVPKPTPHLPYKQFTVHP